MTVSAFRFGNTSKWFVFFFFFHIRGSMYLYPAADYVNDGAWLSVRRRIAESTACLRHFFSFLLDELRCAIDVLCSVTNAPNRKSSDRFLCAIYRLFIFVYFFLFRYKLFFQRFFSIIQLSVTHFWRPWVKNHANKLLNTRDSTVSQFEIFLWKSAQTHNLNFRLHSRSLTVIEIFIFLLKKKNFFYSIIPPVP